jgi:hypothetical protein
MMLISLENMVTSLVDSSRSMARELHILREEWKYTLLVSLMRILIPLTLNVTVQSGRLRNRLDLMFLLMVKTSLGISLSKYMIA